MEVLGNFSLDNILYSGKYLFAFTRIVREPTVTLFYLLSFIVIPFILASTPCTSGELCSVAVDDICSTSKSLSSNWADSPDSIIDRLRLINGEHLKSLCRSYITRYKRRRWHEVLRFPVSYFSLFFLDAGFRPSVTFFLKPKIAAPQN